MWKRQRFHYVPRERGDEPACAVNAIETFTPHVPRERGDEPSE